MCRALLSRWAHFPKPSLSPHRLSPPPPPLQEASFPLGVLGSAATAPRAEPRSPPSLCFLGPKHARVRRSRTVWPRPPGGAMNTRPLPDPRSPGRCAVDTGPVRGPSRSASPCTATKPGGGLGPAGSGLHTPLGPLRGDAAAAAARSRPSEKHTRRLPAARPEARGDGPGPEGACGPNAPHKGRRARRGGGSGRGPRVSARPPRGANESSLPPLGCGPNTSEVDAAQAAPRAGPPGETLGPRRRRRRRDRANEQARCAWGRVQAVLLDAPWPLPPSPRALLRLRP